MSRVIICKGRDVVRRTRKALEALSPQLPRRGSKILIKPNLIEPMPRESGAITRPEIVEGIIQFLGEGHEILIGESSATYKTKECFKLGGYYQLQERYGVRIVDFDDYGFIKLKLDGAAWKEVEVTKFLREADYLISAAVLKEHAFKVTLCLKNMMGVIRPKGRYPNKEYMHREGLSLPWSRRLCDLLRKVKIDLGVIDGTTAMFGSHLFGKLKRLDLTIVSEDAVAADVVASRLLGHRRVFYIELAIKRGLGSPPREVKEISID